MPTERERQEKMLIEKAKELTRKAKARGVRPTPEVADWMNRSPQELAQIVRSLDPKVLKQLSNAIGVDVSPELLSKVDSQSVAMIREIVKEHLK